MAISSVTQLPLDYLSYRAVDVGVGIRGRIASLGEAIALSISS